MTTPETNGADSGRPPWHDVQASAMVQALTAQIAHQVQEIAAMTIYIDQLHRALAAAGRAAEDDVEAVGRGRA